MIEDWQEKLLRRIVTDPHEAALLLRELEERKLAKEMEKAMLDLRTAQAIASLHVQSAHAIRSLRAMREKYQ